MFLGLRTAAYQARDLDKAKAWYSTVLDKQPYFDQPFYVGFNVGGYELGIVPTPDGGRRDLPQELHTGALRTRALLTSACSISARHRRSRSKMRAKES